jgi:raffinose/stachyose/melibiose transport system permease protein
MNWKRFIRSGLPQIAVAALILIIFVIPLVYIVFISGMDRQEASVGQFKIAEQTQYIANMVEVYNASDHMLMRGFKNSLIITAFSIAIMIIASSMAAFVMERRNSKVINIATSITLAGLMIPPSVVTTIWLLKAIGLYKTLVGIIMIEVAIGFPFSAVLYRAFMVTLPRELDEAAVMEGAGTWTLFSRIIFPLLKPVSATVFILSSVNIFNDFVNPLYFLPGAKNVTIQLTLYNFMSQYNTQYNLLFMNILLISLPPLLAFIFFNKKIIGGMVAGAVKG